MSFFIHAMPRASLSPADARITHAHRKPVAPHASVPSADAHRFREEA